jgi:hypothetical protein
MSYTPLNDDVFSKKLANTINRFFPTVVLNNSFQISIFFLVLFFALFVATMIGVSKKEKWSKTIGWLCFTALLLLYLFYGAWYFQDARWGKYTKAITGIAIAILIIFLITFSVTL